jgi:hypothetical protein
LKKNLLLLSLPLAMALSTISCSSNITDVSPKNENVATFDGNNYIIEVSKEKGAEVTVKLNTSLKNSFSAKASANGTAKKLIGDVDHIRVIISTNASDPYGNPVNPYSYVDIGTGPGTVPASANLIFKGLKLGFQYYISARAFEDSNGNLNITQGETALSPEYIDVSPTGILTFVNSIDPANDWDITVPLQDGTGARIDANITAKNGTLGNFALDKFLLNTPNANDQKRPAVSVNKLGNGLAVWEDNIDGYPGIHAVFIKDFVPDGNDFKADENITGSGFVVAKPDVYLNDSGNGFITWSRTAGGEIHIFYNHVVNYRPTKAPVHEDLSQVDAPSGLFLDNAKVSLNSDNSGIFAWQGNDNKIHVRGIASIDKFTNFTLGSDTAITGNDSNSLPAISRINLAGDGMVVWKKSGEIYGKKVTVDNTGAITDGSEIKINENGSANDKPTVSVDANGNGMVVWQSGPDLAGRMIVNYSISGSEFTVEDNGSNQTNPKVSVNENGDGNVVWEDYRNTHAEIYGKNIINYKVEKNAYRIDISTNDKKVPAISLNDNLRGIMVWQDQDTDFNITGKRIISGIPQ